VDGWLALALLLMIAGLLVVALFVGRERALERRTVLVVGVLGAVLALALNVVLGQPLLGAGPDDPSLYSDHLAVAGALTAGLLMANRSLGVLALFLTVFLGVARAGAAEHYPSVALGALAGALCFAVLLPLRQPVGRLIGMMAPTNSASLNLEQTIFPLRHRWVVSVLLVMAAVAGFEIRAALDRGPIQAGIRSEAEHQIEPPAKPPGVYRGVPISEVSGGRFDSAHAAVAGDVTQLHRAVDGDIHFRIESGGAFVVAEIIPELPLPIPEQGQVITAWGIVRHDDDHNWWELHPLIGWAPGNVLARSGPGPALGD